MLQRDRLLKKLEEEPVHRMLDLEEEGISRRVIRELIAAGNAYRVIDGVIATPEAMDDQDLDYVVIHKLTNGVIFGPTAAHVHNMCDVQDQNIHLIVPNAFRRPMPYYPLRFWRTRREEAMTVGVEDFETFTGMKYKITGVARTIVDLYANEAWHQHASESLMQFVGRGGDTDELYAIAAHFGREKEFRLRVEVIADIRTRNKIP